MNVLEAIQTKRSVRAYQETEVPDEVIRQILDGGRRAQSSMNRQPWTFVVVRQNLKELAAYGSYAGPLAGADFGIVLVSSSEWAFDIGQAAAYMQLAAWSLGVSSCLVWLGESEKVRELLGIPADQHVEMAISFGYAKDSALRPPMKGGRKPLEEVVRWEHW